MFAFFPSTWSIGETTLKTLFLCTRPLGNFKWKSDSPRHNHLIPAVQMSDFSTFETRFCLVILTIFVLKCVIAYKWLYSMPSARCYIHAYPKYIHLGQWLEMTKKVHQAEHDLLPSSSEMSASVTLTFLRALAITWITIPCRLGVEKVTDTQPVIYPVSR